MELRSDEYLVDETTLQDLATDVINWLGWPCQGSWDSEVDIDAVNGQCTVRLAASVIPGPHGVLLRLTTPPVGADAARTLLDEVHATALRGR